MKKQKHVFGADNLVYWYDEALKKYQIWTADRKTWIDSVKTESEAHSVVELFNKFKPFSNGARLMHNFGKTVNSTLLK